MRDKTLMDLLGTVKWGMENFGSIFTNRQLPRARMLDAVRLGYCKSVGMALRCDDDGFVMEPERYREGFVLTAKGRKMHRVLQEAYERSLDPESINSQAEENKEEK